MYWKPLNYNWQYISKVMLCGTSTHILQSNHKSAFIASRRCDATTKLQL